MLVDFLKIWFEITVDFKFDIVFIMFSMYTNMIILYLNLPYFHVSNSALIFT